MAFTVGRLNDNYWFRLDHTLKPPLSYGSETHYTNITHAQTVINHTTNKTKAWKIPTQFSFIINGRCDIHTVIIG
ncbi:unnamed protein product [Heterobilharzia americana]|nr:unnamed protein product [Heterobilharzia americana]